VTDLDSQRKLSIDAVRGLGGLLGRHFVGLMSISLRRIVRGFRDLLSIVSEIVMSWRNLDAEVQACGQ
jgi:hypothetical protein